MTGECLWDWRKKLLVVFVVKLLRFIAPCLFFSILREMDQRFINRADASCDLQVGIRKVAPGKIGFPPMIANEIVEFADGIFVSIFIQVPYHCIDTGFGCCHLVISFYAKGSSSQLLDRKSVV